MMAFSSQGFYPKRPVRTFQDLEVYQKALNASAIIMRDLIRDLPNPDFYPDEKKEEKGRGEKNVSKKIAGAARRMGNSVMGSLLLKNMIPCVLSIPHQIAEAHSLRFYDQKLAIGSLERVMVNCNKAVVYIEQLRDIFAEAVNRELAEDLVRQYSDIRRKVFHLETSWKKFNYPPRQ